MDIKNWIKQEIKAVLKENDAFKPEYGTGDVVHDCPKHVQEVKSGKKGKVVAHSLNESGQVKYVDVDFGTGKVFKDIPTKKLKVLEGQTHEHAVKAEPRLTERPITRSKVDYSTMELKSNIATKWLTTDDMLSDLTQWVQSVADASGTGLTRELGMELKELGVNILKGQNVDGEDAPPGVASKFD
tara:strand:- start:1784 stop:2338 length:555 start_codon:yes stop_codon:yes gene_type:complete